MESLLITNGKIVNSDSVNFMASDLFIENGIICEVGANAKNLATAQTQIIDARNMYLFPGGVDVHTHLDLPIKDFTASDSFESGTLAALHGGTTTLIDFANQTKGETAISAFEHWMKLAKNNCHIDYAFHVSLTQIDSSTEEEIIHLMKEGVTSFKTFMAYDNMRLTLEEFSTLFALSAKLGFLITLHAEVGETINENIKQLIKGQMSGPQFHHLSRPIAAEVTAIEKAINLSHKYQVPCYIVHLSSQEGLAKIAAAKKLGIPLLAETCPQYLLLDNSHYSKQTFDEAAKYILSPPLRSPADCVGLWQGLEEGTISTVATDHCPFWLKDKRRGINNFTQIPNGIPGVENRMELLFSEGVIKRNMPLSRFVQLTSSNPAKIFGLYPKKGLIARGADADLVIFDPEKKHTITYKNLHSLCDYSPYEGVNVTGKCHTIVAQGQLAVVQGQCRIQKGRGRYLPRTAGVFAI
ncbi:MAG: dihydropyrimidinase [Bdellovibrionales bacterium RIFOXYD12_FULL_39_22]|nr:MAG: dihydropyrimidinase [Bdellovibrionales bacterium RIFOXYB1_FULL_39_21]OFZ41294.1 MAG: dihydropyrimidinase [Bdellovibrionales bacterium RIFOXYC12_FULL_39_17]OFZ45056.1 MAG: dihydropyrimidinase [Bdellovibrionales bacterium RIFOXYC1_FULL_39_130]OFZ74440.1 MAG: dihydropyrimidinase [Bdellovibrionales bacterium RIFOXYD1_FULL_39_84]OFZ92452.1 MAG: dihydropyrimidinase [Bdellovibrionales bacterium RIFOXYD12_FULL_39_22]HLE12487.1 dihydropyrimidinase [Bacteriovoracaceae bacterium]